MEVTRKRKFLQQIQMLLIKHLDMIVVLIVCLCVGKTQKVILTGTRAVFHIGRYTRQKYLRLFYQEIQKEILLLKRIAMESWQQKKMAYTVNRQYMLGMMTQVHSYMKLAGEIITLVQVRVATNLMMVNTIMLTMK